MALQEAYEYLYDFGLIDEMVELPSISISYDLSITLRDIREDYELYNKDEPVWLYFMEKEYGIMIPYDYLLASRDLLDEDEFYIETTLEHALNVLERVNSIF